MGGLLQASTERLQETAIPGPSPWTWRAGPAEPRCSPTEASVPAMRFAVRVAASSSEVVEVACEARRGRFSARGRSPGAKLEIGVKGACVGDLPASPAATAAAAVQLCPQEESSVEEALFSLCVGGLSPRGRAVGHLNVRRGLTPPEVRPHYQCCWTRESMAAAAMACCPQLMLPMRTCVARYGCMPSLRERRVSPMWSELPCHTPVAVYARRKLT